MRIGQRRLQNIASAFQGTRRRQRRCRCRNLTRLVLPYREETILSQQRELAQKTTVQGKRIDAESRGVVPKFEGSSTSKGVYGWKGVGQYVANRYQWSWLKCRCAGWAWSPISHSFNRYNKREKLPSTKKRKYTPADKKVADRCACLIIVRRVCVEETASTMKKCGKGLGRTSTGSADCMYNNDKLQCARHGSDQIKRNCDCIGNVWRARSDGSGQTEVDITDIFSTLPLPFCFTSACLAVKSMLVCHLVSGLPSSPLHPSANSRILFLQHHSSINSRGNVTSIQLIR